MKSVAALSAIVALANAHATFQQLHKNGEDLKSTCARLPPSNSPIEDYTSNALQCNVNPAPASGKCSFAPGDTVTIEMHQHNDRDCATEGIGGAHWGPVLAYLGKVEDAAKADGSGEFFKIYENGWKKNPAANQGDSDFWGTKDLNYNCGKLDFKIPSDIAAGDYLLRAEAIALHAASSAGGAQHYVTCYQLTVTGSGTVVPKGVKFPEAYSKTGPGLGFSIHTPMDSYPMPGPALIAGGTRATPQLLTFGKISGTPSAGNGSEPAASSAVAAPASSASVVAPAPSSKAAATSTPVSAPASSSAVAVAVSSQAAPKPSAAPSQSSAAPEPEESDCPAEEPQETPYPAATTPAASQSSAAPEPEESDCPAEEPEATPAPSVPTPVTPGNNGTTPAPAVPTTLQTAVQPEPTQPSTGGSIKEFAQCGGKEFKQGGQCASGLICKDWNPYYSQCIKADGAQPAPGNGPAPGSGNSPQPTPSYPEEPSYPEQPTTSQPSSAPSGTAPAVSEPSKVTPTESGNKPTEQTFTIKTFIAWLEKNAGSESAKQIRRMIEALQ